MIPLSEFEKDDEIICFFFPIHNVCMFDPQLIETIELKSFKLEWFEQHSLTE